MYTNHKSFLAISVPAAQKLTWGPAESFLLLENTFVWYDFSRLFRDRPGNLIKEIRERLPIVRVAGVFARLQYLHSTLCNGVMLFEELQQRQKKDS